MATKIYTKTGDGGKTSLIGGTKVPKSDLRIEAYGTVDELNSHIGLCKDLLKDIEGHELLQDIQDRLFTIGSSLACDPEKEPKMKLPDLLESDVTILEMAIDKMNTALEPMKFFILPGGHIVVSQLHIARCVCRRAERYCVRLQEAGGETPQIVIKYLNRLSDYLFVYCRFAGKSLGVPESPWRPRVS